MSSEKPNLDRNWQELLQELRVAQTGVQILAGFLLTIPFSPRFPELPVESRVVYGVALCAAVVSTFLLMTPVALHRVLFHRGARPWLVDRADTAARYGLTALVVANVGALWLILDFISIRPVAWIASVLLTLAVIWLWILVPQLERRRRAQS